MEKLTEQELVTVVGGPKGGAPIPPPTGG